MRDRAMKSFFSYVAILALCGLTIGLAVSSGQEQKSSAQQQREQSNDPESARIFEGKIMRAGGKLVLQDSSGQAYLLEDQISLKQYEGENVKLMAKADPNTNILHVLDIAPTDQTKDNMNMKDQADKNQ
jgi:hypothetical protein